MIQIENLQKSYGKIRALAGIAELGGWAVDQLADSGMQTRYYPDREAAREAMAGRDTGFTLRRVNLEDAYLAQTGKKVNGFTYTEFLIPGLVAMSSMIQSFAIATDINVARFYWGIFEEFQAAPIRNASYLAGEVLAGMSRALIAIAVILLMCLAFGVHLDYGPFLWLAYALLAGVGVVCFLLALKTVNKARD